MRGISFWKPKLAVHFGWASAVAAAWWLGGRNEIFKETLYGPAQPAGLSDAARLKGHLGAGKMAAEEVPHSENSSGAEANAWLRQWRGPDGTISPKQMTLAVKAALADADPVSALRHFTHLLSCLTLENGTAVWNELQACRAGEADPWKILLASAWGKAGPQVFSSMGLKGPASEAAMTAWAAADFEAAKLYLDQLPAEKSGGEHASESLYASLVRGLSRSDPDAAVAFITGLGENQRRNLVRVMAEERLNQGPAAAAHWARELPDEAMRRAALETVARRYMQVDAAGGSAWAAEIASERDTREAVGRVADRMAEKDVKAAFAWTLQLPASPGQEEAFQQVFSEWARQDPGASSEELRSMPRGKGRDQAIHSFSRILVDESPEDAIVWASAIQDPALRLDTQIDVARTWGAAAPEAARQWVASHLPAEAHARALDQPK